jgi:glutathione S-transferase
VDDGFALWESRTIMTYLIDKYAKDDTLYPKDLAIRARVNQRLLFDAELYERFGDYYYPPFEGKRGNVERLKKAVAYVQLFEQDLGDEKYAVGDKLTVADIALVVTISVAERLGYDLSVHPNVSAWFSRCKAEIKGYQEINQHGLDVLKKLIPSNEEHKEL